MDYGKEEMKSRYRIPATAISVDEDVATVKVEMPGVPKDGLEIRIDGNELAISGSRKEEEFPGTYLLRERSGEPFRKLLTLDDSIDRDRIEAELKDGILTLKLRVKEAAKPRRIEIA